VEQRRSDEDRTPTQQRPLQEFFERSANAILIADDRRRYTDANEAACTLLGMSREQLLQRRIDDFTPPEALPQMRQLWKTFLEVGTQAGQFELVLPTGARREVEYSATANFAPGQHLSVFLDPGRDLPSPAPAETPVQRPTLTARQREVLALVALGATTDDIANGLGISAETARSHVKNAMEKLGARNRAHAVALALRHEMIALP
jgi:PAS domain S-box-containing protein